jgi:hypothetical protein
MSGFLIGRRPEKLRGAATGINAARPGEASERPPGPDRADAGLTRRPCRKTALQPTQLTEHMF